jgi:hypothetical protein
MVEKKEINWDKHTGIDPRILEPFSLPALVGLSGVWIESLLNHPDTMIPWAVGGATVYVLSAIADSASTFSALPDIAKANKFGFDCGEANKTVPDVPTVQDFFKIKPLAVEIGAEIASILVPPLGLVFSGQRYLAAINNVRVRKDIRARILTRKRGRL